MFLERAGRLGAALAAGEKEPLPEPSAEVTKSGMTLKDGTSLPFSLAKVKAAMDKTGILVDELVPKDPSSFGARGKMNGVVHSTRSLQKLRHHRAEDLRCKTLDRLLAEIVRADEEAAARGDVVDDYASRGDTAIAMMAEQGAMLLAQEEAKAKQIAEATAERAAAEAAQAREAEALKEANRIKNAAILKKFEEDKAAFEAQVKARRAEAMAASMRRIRKKEEDFEAEVIDARKKEKARVIRDREIEAVRKVRLAEMQERSLAFGKKRMAKVARIQEDRIALEKRMKQIGNEKEALCVEKEARVKARADAKNAAIKKANAKKQREIQVRLAAKNKERAEIEAQKNAQFEEKIVTVDKRLEKFVQEREDAIQHRIKAREDELKARDVRLEQLRIQREMAGASGLDKAEMKAVICAQAAAKKRDGCLLAAVENQARFESKLAYIAQQRRLEDARVAEMTEESDKKAVRSQKVIDAKRAYAESRRKASMKAVVDRAKLSAKADISRGGDYEPLDWMITPLSFENQDIARANSVGTRALLVASTATFARHRHANPRARAEFRHRASDMFAQQIFNPAAAGGFPEPKRVSAMF